MDLSDVAAERGLIAGVCTYHGDAYVDVCDIIDVNAFTLEINQATWKCIDYIFKNDSDAKIDYLNIKSAAQALGLSLFFEKTDDNLHLRSLMNFPVRLENVRSFAGVVRKLQLARDGVKQLDLSKVSLLGLTGRESVDEIIKLVEEPALAFSANAGKSGSGSVLMGEGSTEYYEHLLDNPCDIIGISTGFRRWDRSLGGGLREGCLDLIGARQKSGKSMLLDNFGLAIASQNIPVLAVDTEMTKPEHQIRVGGCLAGIDTNSIEQGKLGPADRLKLMNASKKLQSIPYYYDSVIGMPVEEVLSRIRRWIIRIVGLDENGKAKPCVVLYDYIKLMSVGEITRNIAEHQMLGFITQSLKNIMGKYGARCICFAQLNRDALDYEDTRVIRGSDRILDPVTSFSIYKWKSAEERAEASQANRKYTHKLAVVISRFGPGMEDDDYINIAAEYAQARVIEGPTAFELQAQPERNPAGFVVDDTQQVEFGEPG